MVINKVIALHFRTGHGSRSMLQMRLVRLHNRLESTTMVINQRSPGRFSATFTSCEIAMVVVRDFIGYLRYRHGRHEKARSPLRKSATEGQKVAMAAT